MKWAFIPVWWRMSKWTMWRTSWTFSNHCHLQDRTFLGAPTKQLPVAQRICHPVFYLVFEAWTHGGAEATLSQWQELQVYRCSLDWFEGNLQEAIGIFPSNFSASFCRRKKEKKNVRQSTEMSAEFRRHCCKWAETLKEWSIFSSWNSNPHLTFLKTSENYHETSIFMGLGTWFSMANLRFHGEPGTWMKMDHL